jgi:hypothetical protein
MTVFPEVFYVVSLGRSQRIDTKEERFSCHHIAPELFGGFRETAAGAMLAAPEKALFDLAYLSGGCSRRFSTLPELELPRKFRRAELSRWLERIPSARSKTLTARKLDALLAKATHGDACPDAAHLGFAERSRTTQIALSARGCWELSRSCATEIVAWPPTSSSI